MNSRYSIGEIGGALVVIIGAIIAIFPLLTGHADGDDDGDRRASVAPILIYVLSVAPCALSFVIKETIFVEMVSKTC